MRLEELWTALLRELIGEAIFTPPEVAVEAGVPIEATRRLWRALGFGPVPDEERIFTAADVAMLRTAQQLADGGIVKPDTLMQLARVMGQTLSRLAEAQIASTNEVRRDDGQAEDEVERARALAQVLEPFVTYSWRRHLLAAMWRQITAEQNLAGEGRSLIVGFADLVGFTAMSQMISDRDLEAIVSRFESLIYEQIPERGGRVIKLIGDEVMFVAELAQDAAEIALNLVDAHAKDASLPDIRVGMAVGPALSWEGDIYGATVNLASRLVNLARPATVLVSEELATLLRVSSGYALRELRPVTLKGIGRKRILVLRRSAAEEAGEVEKRPAGRRKGRRREAV